MVEHLRRLLALGSSVTVHMVAAQMVVEEACLVPGVIGPDQKHDRIAINRASGTAEADHNTVDDADVH